VVSVELTLRSSELHSENRGHILREGDITKLGFIKNKKDGERTKLGFIKTKEMESEQNLVLSKLKRQRENERNLVLSNHERRRENKTWFYQN